MKKYIFITLLIFSFTACQRKEAVRDDYTTVGVLVNETSVKVDIYSYPLLDSSDTIGHLYPSNSEEIYRQTNSEPSEFPLVKSSIDSLVVVYDDTLSVRHYLGWERKGAFRSLYTENFWNGVRDGKTAVFTYLFTEADYQEALSLQK